MLYFADSYALIRFYEEPTVGKPTVLAHSKNSREASSFTCLRSRQYSVGLTIEFLGGNMG